LFRAAVEWLVCPVRRSSGCGDGTCSLCQYNPSRICKRNLKSKYLIDDHLRAKCGAGLRVEVVDENGQCVVQPPADMHLEVRGGALGVVAAAAVRLPPQHAAPLLAASAC
jgi:hypothetical protein